MKKLILLTLIFTVFGIYSFSQTITTKPNSTIYLLKDSKKQSHGVSVNGLTSGFLLSERYFNDLVDSKSKILKKPIELNVIGCFNTVRQLEYNAYLVDYKGKRYAVLSESIQDNTIINQKNEALISKYKRLESDVDSSRKAIDILYAEAQQFIRDSIEMYDSIAKYHTQLAYSVKVNFKKDVEKAFDKQLQDEYSAIYNKLSSKGKKASDLIWIRECYMGSADAAGGRDGVLEYINLSTKPIKYLYWYGYAKNSVGDRVGCEIRGFYTFDCKDTGPVKQYEFGGGRWDCIIYNYSATELVVSSIEVVYMDGTSISISQRDVDLLRMMPCQFVEGQKNPIMRKYIGISSYQYGLTYFSDEYDRRYSLWKQQQIDKLLEPGKIRVAEEQSKAKDAQNTVKDLKALSLKISSLENHPSFKFINEIPAYDNYDILIIDNQSIYDYMNVLITRYNSCLSVFNEFVNSYQQ